MYRMHQIKLGLNEPKENIKKVIIKKIGKKNLEITDYIIIKESIDARDKGDIKLVYTVDFNVSDDECMDSKIEKAPDIVYKEVESGNIPLKKSPVIVGFGPCGIFAALILADRGYNPIVIERGSSVEKRIEDVNTFWNTGKLNVNSNVQFGEGGAGTFSDGKLTTGIKDPRIRKVLEEFVRAGADEDILYKQKPHIGTDVLQQVVANIRNHIIEKGGRVLFDTLLEEVVLTDNKVTAVKVRDVSSNDKGSESNFIETENVIMAIGHSSRDTFRRLLSQGVIMKQKPFSIGLRIEHPQELIDRSQYGKAKGLPPADYKLSHHCKNGRGVYTFCMCPGGQVIGAASQEGGVVTNGMSNRNRDSGIANSALLCDVRIEDFGSNEPLAGVDFQEKYEKLAFKNGGSDYTMPKTTWGEFKKKSDKAMGVIDSLPDFAVEAIIEAMPFLGRKIRSFDGDDVVMTAVETRSSSPVRFLRGDDYQSNISGVYPAGEGAGYAGGIMSAACDGIKIAEQIISLYLPSID